jgi:hypothetical protein
LPYEDLAQWSARVFGEKKFGIILNTGEKFNERLSAGIAAQMAPLFAQIGFLNLHWQLR